ncbi:hypothetical protein [Streptomyces sp. BK205]|uniref:hypothetical protein n=1 Tax=unclassified Streptomyces TaxID=2593676 RepID=UPI00104D0585|nr:hypothetical protein [Streptomyces sp. BK205]TCR23717.1 hypothetical protein EV578_10336 [Streptomyces sp. BK205]
MTTRTTFEDRLLVELRGEVQRRAAVPAPAARRRVLTGRRLALAVVGCGVAGAAVVLSPGTPAGSSAYALERHGDGSVTLTVKDQDIDVEAQRALARRLQPNGIEVDVQILRPGYVCKGDLVLWVVGEKGEKVPLHTLQLNKPTALRPGNVLVFVNTNDGRLPHRVRVYPTQADVEPCVPVKPTPDLP